jgi:hypothetical protein
MMDLHVYYVMLKHWRQGTIFFSNALSLLIVGTRLASIGIAPGVSLTATSKQKDFSPTPVSWKFLSARLGIFGRKEMTSSSSNKFLPWLAGGFVFKVIYYFTSIESSLH